ncbi:MAG: hypothetical protein ACLGI3_04940, partial [Actinomycetes bacterium]
MDDGPRPAMAAAPADRAADVSWEPVDWDATLRERRRAEWRDVVLMLAVFLVVLPVLQVAVFDDPLRAWHWVWFAWALVLTAHAIRSHFTVRGRERWELQTRQEVRVEHALRFHVSIGAADRDLVTGRADEIDSWAPAHFVGWPLAAVVVAAAAVSDPTLSAADQILAWLIVAFCAA